MILFPAVVVKYLVYVALAATAVSTLRLWRMLYRDWKNGGLW